MNVQEFIEEAIKLFIEDEESSKEFIVKRLSNQRTKLVSLINQLDEQSERFFSVKKRTVVKNVRSLYDVIIGSVNLFLNGQFAESRDKIHSRFFDRDNPLRDPLPAKGITVGNSNRFFRLRSNDTYNLYKKKEMFHIPFEKRGSVTNQRFSISGYPCLYLGSSIYCCWEETQRPNVELCNIVSMKNARDLSFIDLSIPTIEHNWFNESSVYQLVLPLACSLKVINQNDTFKAEYIVPQNVLSCIVQRNPNDVIEFDGIIYTSTINGRAECLFNDKEKLTNYVIPIKTSKESGLCERLVDSFQISEPTSMLMERLKKNVAASYMAYDNSAELHIYENTIWGVTENILVKKPHEKIS